MAGNNLPAMMPLSKVMSEIIMPAYELLPAKMVSVEATVAMLAIGRQESKFKFRLQVPNGPAKGFWQFESGGSVKGVMNHPSTHLYAKAVCDALGVRWDRKTIYDRLEFDDILAACFARLNLWWTPGPLPRVGQIQELWTLYADVAWRPGKPHPETWSEYYDEAVAEVHNGI